MKNSCHEPHVDWDKKYGSLGLAERIDKSTDIVTVLSDVIEQGVTGLRVQIDDRAEEILDKIDHISVGTTGLAREDTLVSGILSIREDISHIEIDTTILAKEETLIQGITGVRADIAQVASAVQGLTGYATESQATANKEEILQAIHDIEVTPIPDEHIEGLFPEIEE